MNVDELIHALSELKHLDPTIGGWSVTAGVTVETADDEWDEIANVTGVDRRHSLAGPWIELRTGP
jgi:hypothetical protein